MFRQYRAAHYIVGTWLIPGREEFADEDAATKKDNRVDAGIVESCTTSEQQLFRFVPMTWRGVGDTILVNPGCKEPFAATCCAPSRHTCRLDWSPLTVSLGSEEVFTTQPREGLTMGSLAALRCGARPSHQPPKSLLSQGG